MQNEEKCIIIINGEKYDFTEFKKKHPGGDIFNCGTDMTTAFMANHGNDLKRLQPFKLKSENDKIDSNSDKEIREFKTTKSTEIVDINETSRKQGSESPNLYSMQDLDKALQEELDEL